MFKLALLLLSFLIIQSCQVKETANEDGVVSGHTPSDAEWTVIMPASAWYKLGDHLNITIRFPIAVTVTGIPRLSVELGSAPVSFNYLSGSGTRDLLFRYTVTASDLDSNGIEVDEQIQLNGGSLQYASSGTVKNCPIDLTIPPSIVRVDGIKPVLNSVTGPADGTYPTATNLNYHLGFSEPVYSSGTPSFDLLLDSGAVPAYYGSGNGTLNLTFRRVVGAGDLDADGYETGNAFSFASGNLKDAAGNSVATTFPVISSPNVLVNVSSPYIESVAVPVASTYTEGQVMDFTVAYNQAVNVTGTPTMTIALTTGNVEASYVSGSGSSHLVFRHTVGAGEEDFNGIVVSSPLELEGGSIKGAITNLDASLSFTSPAGVGRNVDAKDPVVMSVNKPLDGTYSAGQTLTFDLIFNETVTVSGSPYIQAVIGSTTRNIPYTSGSGTGVLKFSYTIAAGELDTDGISLTGQLLLNGGSIKDSVSRNAVLTYVAPVTTGILVDAANPVIATITPPLDGTYKAPQQLDFVANFNKNVTITGTPRFHLTLGSSSVFATYVSGSGTSNILFRYTIQANDLDDNGIGMNSPLNLNGGAIKDSRGNNATLTFTAPTTTGVLVDAKAPLIANLTPPANGSYSTGQNLDFVANFNEDVFISGAPRLQLMVGSNTVYANYQSGSGTSAVTFRYTVTSADTDTDGIQVTSPLVLNGGSIRDMATNIAVLTFTPPDTSGVKIDALLPLITSVTPPSDGTYQGTQNVNFLVNFNKNISVTGSPRIALTVGSATVYATYTSGSGTSALTFTYTVQNNHYDTDGIVLTSPLELNGGSLKDSSGNNSSLTFTLPDADGVLIDALLPVISSVAGPAHDTYETSQNLDFIVTFNKPVDILGSVQIALTVGSSTVYAVYHSGSGTDEVTFRYTVQASDVDTDGIASSSPIQLNSGSIKDALLRDSALTFTAPDTSGVIVDAILPAIASVVAPADGTYKLTDQMDFTVNFTKKMTVTGSPQIALTVNTGGPTVYAIYQTGSGTNALTFRYTVTTGVSDSDGIVVSSPVELNSGSIKDAHGNDSALTFTAPTTTGVLIDGIVPVISSVTAPADGTYKLNQNMDFTVTWSEAVAITGSPRIAITIETGGPTVYATYQSGSGSTSTIFRYTVALGNADANGVTLDSAVSLNGGAIKDASGNNADPLTFTLPTTTGLKVDGLAPYIVSVSAPSNGTYKETQNLNFTVVWSETVTITGAPRIPLTVGTTSLYATYVSGSGTTNTVFRYTVATGEEDLNGIAAASPLSLNGGTITDASTNPAATLTFTPPGTSSVLVDGKAPVLSGITPPASDTYKPGEQIQFTVTYHENVTVTGTPRLTLTVDSTTRYATYVSGSGTANLLFRYTVAASNAELDLDGIAATTSVDLNGGTIRDSVAHNADLAYSSMDLGQVYVIYSNMVMWFNFNDDSTVTTVTCGTDNCITAVTDKSGAGNNITSGTTPGPVYEGSGYGSGNSAYAQYNNSSYLNLPNKSSIKYYAVTMRTDSSTSTHALIGGPTDIMYFYRSSGRNRQRFSTSTSLRSNTSSVSSPSTNVSSPQWSTSANTIYWFSVNSTVNFNSHTLGDNAFNGRIVEFFAFDSSATLSTAQLDKVRDYMNDQHGAY